ncbi:MAG: cadmium-translocating P-type ATPase, partial [Calditrichaeota bacterium]
MENTLQLKIPLLLPQVEDEKDQCVERLLERVKGHRGIEKAHIEQVNDHFCFCFHYNPDLVSLTQVQRLAEEAGAAVAERYRHDTIRITDMDCGDCAVSIEHILGRLKGIINVSVNYAAEKMRVEYDSTLISQAEIIKRIKDMGYRVEIDEAKVKNSWVRRNWELVLSIFAGIFLAAGFLGETYFEFPRLLVHLFYMMAYLAGGYDAARHGIKAAIHLRFDIDFLMVVAALGAAVVGEWAEGAFLLFLFSMGHALEHLATDRARNAIRALGEITPKTARVRRDGRERELPVEEVLRGDIVIVRSGERIPVDGVVVEGFSTVDQSPITGESMPVEKQKGDQVFAGTVNGDGALVIEVTKLARDTTLARVIQMVEEAQTQKSPTQRFTQKFESIFVPTILIGVTFMIVVPPVLGGLSWKVSFLRAMAMLVAASPCALAIATPSAILSGIARAARSGVLIKGGVHLENLGVLQAIAFDKTGTITRGQPVVTDVIPLDDLTQEDVLRIAAAVESRSVHPLAQAIVKEAETRQLDYPEVESMESIVGRGVRAKWNGQVIAIGNLKLFQDELQDKVPESVISKVSALESNGKTTMIVKQGQKYRGIIALADLPRPEAKTMIDTLKKIGIKALIMITGDNDRVAAAIASQVGLTEYRANLLPEDKVEAIKELLKRHSRVAMVGDGVNDAPAMKTATVG